MLLGAGVLGILLPVVETGRGGASVPWWVAVVGVAFLFTFFGWERAYTGRGRSPLVDLALFRVPGYASGAAVGTIYFAGFTGIFFVLTIFFQESLGYTPLLAGLAVTPFAAGSAVTSAIGGRLVSRFERSLVTGGLIVVLVGVIGVDVVLATVRDSSLGWWLAGPLLVAGIGSGLVISPNITLTVAQVPSSGPVPPEGSSRRGSASARPPGSRSSARSSTPALLPARDSTRPLHFAWQPLSSPWPSWRAPSTCEGDAVARAVQLTNRTPEVADPPRAEPSAVSLRPRGRTSSRRRGPPRCAPVGVARWRR